MEGNSCVIDSDGDVLIRILHQVVPEELVQLAENVTQRLANQLGKKHVKSQRGDYWSVIFGSYVERGGSGQIHTRKEVDCPTFLRDIDSLGCFANHWFAKLCPVEASKVAQVPNKYKLWRYISLMFWNATSVSKSHVDSRDYNWCLVMPFGSFTIGSIDLPYLNTTFMPKRRDLYLLRSNKVFHNVLPSSITRQSFVFTNHSSVVRRFVDI